MLGCCYTDLRSQKIYNIVLLPAVLAAVSLNTFFVGAEGFLASVQGLLLGMALLLIPFVAGGIGAGDVKLLGAVGALTGPELVFVVFLTGAVSGGLLSALLLAKRKKLLFTLKKIFHSAVNKLLNIPVSFSFNKLDTAAEGESIPYALAISLGVIWAYMLG